ncbi:MAG: rhodanese-like domain-containing protein [Gammaproteobacteria bacterium]|nr:rhodanese-like domain-containing protein [Gammaproteobacteria bacterium]MYJ74516.1 rhodanese-like domain-containing protein [Gammaproteobacteria bacterium]
MIRLRTAVSTAFAMATALLLVQAASTAEAPQERLEAEDRWAKTLRIVRETFPDVPQLSTERLAEALEADADVVLLDARSKEEFETSHLQGAVRATSIRSAREALKEHGKKSMVVVYCSVGYRSSRLAQKLRATGVENVFNLEGSLFKWANEGRPVYRASEQVRTVHPFDEDWGDLLDRALWSNPP